MSAEPLLFWVGDLDPSYQDVIKVGGSIKNLTGKTGDFKMRAVGSTTYKVNQPLSNNASLTSDGVVRYDWVAADVDTAGFFLAHVVIKSGTRPQTLNETLVEFRAHGPHAKGLCEIGDVRLQVGTDSKDRNRDARLGSLIPVASVALARYAQREFLPAAAASRDFPVRAERDEDGRYVVDLAPYDLRTATTVTIDPGGADQAVLVAGTDYQLSPVGKDAYGVYTELVLDDGVVMPQTVPKFGEGTLRIVGDWGMPTVPEEAKQACIVTVRSWLYRDTASAFTDPEQRQTVPDVPRNYAIPKAAKSLLHDLRRISI